MADFLGHFNASSSRTTVRFAFTTHAQTGAAVAPSSAFEAADLKIYKDGSATERTSASGITMTSPFDSVTGLHFVSIDLTDNTDAGFWAAGSHYTVVLSPDETVDSLAVVRVLAYFEIGPSQVNVTQFGGTAGTFSSGRPEVNTSHIAGSAVSTSSAQIGVNVVNAGGTAWGSGAITAASIAADAITDAKVASDVTIASVTGSVGSVTGNVGGNVTGSVGSIATGGITASSFAASAIDAAALAPDAGTEIATAVWASGTRTLTAGTNINGSTFTAIPWNASWDAEVQSEVQDALEVNHLDHLLATAADGTECANSTYWARLVSKSATPAFSSFVNTTDSLEALRDRGDAGWTTATGFSTHSAADVWSVATRVLTAGTNIALAKGTGVTGFNDLAAADVRSAVGLASANLDTQLDALPTAVENADALLGRNVAGGSSTGRTVSQALFVLRNKVAISGGTMTVYSTDDTTSSWTASLTSDAAADPITAVDPA